MRIRGGSECFVLTRWLVTQLYLPTTVYMEDARRYRKKSEGVWKSAKNNDTVCRTTVQRGRIYSHCEWKSHVAFQILFQTLINLNQANLWVRVLPAELTLPPFSPHHVYLPNTVLQQQMTDALYVCRYCISSPFLLFNPQRCVLNFNKRVNTTCIEILSEKWPESTLSQRRWSTFTVMFGNECSKTCSRKKKTHPPSEYTANKGESS